MLGIATANPDAPQIKHCVKIYLKGQMDKQSSAP